MKGFNLKSNKNKQETSQKNRANMVIFFMLAFDIKELHTLFMKFYSDFDADENLTFDMEEMT